ncbi:Diphthine methyltransferase [Abortiporus biennis]
MSRFDTVWPADSIEFCPHPLADNIFVCGTYKLDQPEDVPPPNDDGEDEDQPLTPRIYHRRGKCMVFEVDDHNDYKLIREVDLPAVPDMKWCHRTDDVNPILGVADSEGHISLYDLDPESKHLNKIQSIECAPSTVLCLSLDWSNRRTPSSGLGSLIVSLSNGSLALLEPDSTSELSISSQWEAHEFEPWIAAWNYWDTNVIYSGGDDLKLKGWDIRSGFSQPTFVNKRFDAGVTTIQSHPYVEHIIAVGSYDNSVRLFDMRKPLVPLVQADVGGGAWRVKWHPSSRRRKDLLVACMHDGFKVVRFNALGDPVVGGGVGGKEWDIVKRFDKHESLAYGVDWSFREQAKDESLIASCSFYDHLLHVWEG